MCLAEVLLPMDPLAQAARGMPRNSATSLADSDEFRIYNAKILPCRKRYHHDWNECIFAHVGEKVQRRCPRKYNYMGIMCPEMKRFNECPKGDDCCFAHNSFEYWLHQDRYRTEMCTFGPACKRCICFFAHTPEELRGYGRTLNGPAGPRSYNPSLRTPVVVGNRMDFPNGAPPASARAPQQPGAAVQAPYSQAQDYYPGPRPAMQAPAFSSPDPYSPHADPYMANTAYRQPSPALHALAPSPNAFPDALPPSYMPTSTPLPTQSALHLPDPSPAASPAALNGQASMAASARYISLLANRTAPTPTTGTSTPTFLGTPGLLNPYSPSHPAASAPTPIDPLPSARSPTASTTSSSSSAEPALPGTPAAAIPTPFSTTTTSVPALGPMYLHHQAPYQAAPLSLHNPAPAGRYSPFSPDSPLLALLPSQPHHPTADLIADQLAETHLGPPTVASSQASSSRRPSLHTPASPTSPLAPPTTLQPHQPPLATFTEALSAPAPSPAAILAAMASKSLTAGYPQQYDQYEHFHHYLPQLSAGLAAVANPQQLHAAEAEAQPQYTMLEAASAAMTMAQLPTDGYQQLGRTGPELLYMHQRPSLNHRHLSQ